MNIILNEKDFANFTKRIDKPKVIPALRKLLAGIAVKEQ